MFYSVLSTLVSDDFGACGSYAHEVKNSVGHEKERVELLPPEALMQGSQVSTLNHYSGEFFRRLTLK